MKASEGSEGFQVKVPVLSNDAGLQEIVVYHKHFGCMGVSPPLDHPHVYLNMGIQESIVCPYCSTRFVYQA